jgi:acyl-coenzyme A synthetase/AMP-(fatty) acid ligase
MQRNWRETMKGAISEVLETMFFTPVEFIGELPKSAIGKILRKDLKQMDQRQRL